jgi:hypothetical protein
MSTSMEKLKNAMKAMEDNKTSGGQHNQDFWRAEQDKAGNGFAVIRFLPAKQDDQLPWVQVYSHGWKNEKGKWFIDDCPTTIGRDCPVCESNGVLWNSGSEKDKETVRQRKRKLSYISNVLVISDPKNPDNDGKVFLFKYGKKIFDKIKEAMSPEVVEGDPDVPKEINPFDENLKTGANFKLKIRKVEGFANFDKSEFTDATDVDNWDEVLTQARDLTPFVDPAAFKSYDALKIKLDRQLGITDNGFSAPSKPAAPATPADIYDDDIPFDTGTDKKAPQRESVSSKPAVVEDDDDMSYFRSLAADD